MNLTTTYTIRFIFIEALLVAFTVAGLWLLIIAESPPQAASAGFLVVFFSALPALHIVISALNWIDKNITVVGW